MLKEKQETGRSMIEMLGVLAIIGVLSVGGIAGYTTAMRSHRANEIVNATSMLYMLGLAQNAGEGTGTLTFDTAFGTSMRPSGCGGITYKGDKATLDVNIEDETICKQVKTKLGDKAGDCTAATGGATGYTLTVTLGDTVVDPSSITTPSECYDKGYVWLQVADATGCYANISAAGIKCPDLVPDPDGYCSQNGKGTDCYCL